MTTNTPAQVAVKPDLRATIERLIEDAMIDAEVDYPAGSDAGHRISWDSDSLLNGIMALIPAPAPAEQDPVAWNGPGEKPHEYSPDYMAMGDCRICGHTRDAHYSAPVPAVPDDVAETAKRLRQATFAKGRMRGGIGGQTIEASMRSTFHEVSAWDLDIAADALDAQAAELARLRGFAEFVTTWAISFRTSDRDETVWTTDQWRELRRQIAALQPTGDA
ncbi:hypothetical protein PARHAE_00708 [Paracoccus haematequi]|uniref:Uncharacterized protein n=1 Tax=Paracoccus haematequi TaxID=2491866 RepID=A0A3S4CHZ7_9RHOB|nr:hypothetical protein [Paracoccus haematequi]VDS07531.1 hypothetical protein PARHAE_00708 [Paracoccus haematequi]